MTAFRTVHQTVAAPTPASGDLSLFYLFSATLLSTMQLNKLLHLMLSALVYPENRLFERAMLFMYNQKAQTLQGMLGISRELTDGLRLVDVYPDNPLSGHWDLDSADISRQWRSELSIKVRGTRIDLQEGCRIVANVVKQQRLYRVEEDHCRHCQDCGFVKRFGIDSFVAVPLLTRNNLIGVIIVDAPESHQPVTDDQLKVLQMLANQGGMAIENTRLYHTLDEAHTELRDTRQRLVHGAHLAAIGEMAATISHELKTPLITIGGFAARLARTIPEEAPQRHYLDTIINESHRLERLLSDILAFSRKPTICYQSCDFRSVLQECLADYALTLTERQIDLELTIAEGSWVVQGDANQLKQVCINLLVNAQEAMGNGGRLTVTVGAASERGRPMLVLTVSDTGGGIPADLAGKIFTPFFTTKRHGTGLGLAIVNRIVQNHGGTLQAENSNEGARFLVTLPLASA